MPHHIDSKAVPEGERMHRLIHKRSILKLDLPDVLLRIGLPLLILEQWAVCCYFLLQDVGLQFWQCLRLDRYQALLNVIIFGLPRLS